MKKDKATATPLAADPKSIASELIRAQLVLLLSKPVETITEKDREWILAIYKVYSEAEVDAYEAQVREKMADVDLPTLRALANGEGKRVNGPK